MSNNQGVMGRKPEKSSNFAMTCSLLSQFIKEKGRSLGDLGLGVAPSRPNDAFIAKTETIRPPTTMSLLPGVDVTGDDGAAETRDIVSGRNASRSMELFPQRAGFGTTAPPADTTRVPERAQLTIFYGGKVLVFDNFPAEKAGDLMQLAGKGSAVNRNYGFLPPSSVPPATVDVQNCSANRGSTLVPSANKPPVAVQCVPNGPNRPSISDLPIARKASLHRFLEKRKDRINAKAPYQVQVKDSPAMAATIKKEEIVADESLVGFHALSLGRRCL